MHAQCWLRKTLGESQAEALLEALLLGKRGRLLEPTKRHFSKTGTAHLLAISGLHLAIIAHLLFLFFSWLLSHSRRLLMTGAQRTVAVYLSAPWVVGYALLSGASPSTQRALGMLLWIWLGVCLKRRPSAGVTLALLLWPLLSTTPDNGQTASFQMSFLAVAALLWMTRKERTSGSLMRWLRAFKSLVMASLFATLATLPLVLRFSPYVPIWGPLINLLAVPLGGYLVLGSGLTALAVWLLSPTAAAYLLHLSAAAATLLLQYLQLCARLPGTFRSLPLTSLEWFVYYATLLSALSWYRWRKGLIIGGIAWSLWGVMQLASYCAPPSRLLQIHFLDVGQGDAAFLRFPNGQTMLIDAGGRGFGVSHIGTRVVVPWLRANQVRRLDYAVLSHPHPDHFSGFLAVFKTLPVGQFWDNGQPCQHPRFQALLAARKQHQIPTRRFTHPTRIKIGSVELTILHPFPRKHEGTTYYWSLCKNDNSLVILLRYKRIRVLFTGDIERRGEELLVQRWPQLHVDLLKAPHHGSKTSSSARFLAQLHPRHVVISAGRQNAFGFPHTAVLRRYKHYGVQIWRTDLHGQVHVQTDGETLNLRTALNTQKIPK